MESAKCPSRWEKGEGSYGASFVRVPDTQHVQIRHLTTCVDGKAYMEYVLDLSNMSEDEILEHCARDINIQIMRPKHFTQIKVDKCLEEHGTVFAPEDFKSTTRVSKDPKRRAGDAIAKLAKTLGEDAFVSWAKDELGVSMKEAKTIYLNKIG